MTGKMVQLKNEASYHVDFIILTEDTVVQATR